MGGGASNRYKLFPFAIDFFPPFLSLFLFGKIEVKARGRGRDDEQERLDINTWEYTVRYRIFSVPDETFISR